MISIASLAGGCLYAPILGAFSGISRATTRSFRQIAKVLGNLEVGAGDSASIFSDLFNTPTVGSNVIQLAGSLQHGRAIMIHVNLKTALKCGDMTRRDALT